MANSKKILIVNQDHVYLLEENDIKYCQSDDGYTTVFVKDGSEHLISKTLIRFSKELDRRIFIRVNQSFLININYIKSINKKNKNITLDGCIAIPFTLTIKDLMIMISSVYDREIGAAVPE